MMSTCAKWDAGTWLMTAMVYLGATGEGNLSNFIPTHIYTQKNDASSGTSRCWSIASCINIINAKKVIVLKDAIKGAFQSVLRRLNGLFWVFCFEKYLRQVCTNSWSLTWREIISFLSRHHGYKLCSRWNRGKRHWSGRTARTRLFLGVYMYWLLLKRSRKKCLPVS